MIRHRVHSSYPKNEKIKWALVAVLGMVLLGVGYSNFRPSSGGKIGLTDQPESAQESDILNSLPPEKLSVESPEVLTAEPEAANSLASPMIQNIFAFASRKDLPGPAPTPRVGSSSELAFLDTGLTNGMKYFSRVRAVAGDVMSPFVLAIEASAGLDEAAERMLDDGFHRLLVMDRTKLIGIVTSMDLLRGFLREGR